MVHNSRGGYQPPATWRFQRARLKGIQFRRNVGGDTHIAPPGWIYVRARLNGEMSIYLVPFNIQGGSDGFRVDVGIDPYIKTIRAFHSAYSSISVRGERLAAAPTGEACHPTGGRVAGQVPGRVQNFTLTYKI